MSFNFGAPSTNNAPAPATGGFSFGSTTAPAAPAGGGFSFGKTTKTTTDAGGKPAATGFSFGGSSASTVSGAGNPASSGGFSFGGATNVKPSNAAGSGFSFGKPTATDANASKPTLTGGVSFGDASKPNFASGINFGGNSAPAPSTGDSKTPVPGGFSFGTSLKRSEESKAPAASAGFSFGAPQKVSAETTNPPAIGAIDFGKIPTKGNAPPPAGGDTAKEAKRSNEATVPPAVSGGFLFGASAPPKDPSSTAVPAAVTPAIKTGFSFGGVDTPAPKAPSPVKTPNENNATPGSTSTPATTTKTPSTVTKPQVIEPPPIEYQSLTVEQIINRFQSELETDTISFLQEAQRIAHYDATLRDSQQSLSELTNAVSRLMIHQSEVDAQLTGIGSYQSELATTLDQLERNVDELFAAQSNVSVQDSDIERDRAYERALEVDSRLDQMNNVLENVVSDMNAAQERVWSSSGHEGFGRNEEVGKILGVFHAHHETLGQLENKARAVESEVAMISQALAKSGH